MGEGLKSFALLGHNIAYSLSPKIHSLIFEHLKIEARYGIIDIGEEELPQNLQRLKFLNGFNVTQPHKRNILRYLDENASGFNAVNTVKNLNGRLVGYNTDVYGFEKHFSSFCPSCRGEAVLIIGAGGMAEAAAQVLAALGAFVYILNRTIEKAERICEISGARLYSEKVKPKILINCSSAYLSDNNLSLPKADYSSLAYAYDTIYFETGFIRAAEALGAKAENGLGMLIYQAIKAEEIFLDIKIKDKEELYLIIKEVLK